MNESEQEVARELDEIHRAVSEHRPDPQRELVRGKARQQQAHRAAKKAATKRQITARFDQDVLEEFRQLAGEGSYQRLMNQALREWLQGRRMEGLVREAMREEFEAMERRAQEREETRKSA